MYIICNKCLAVGAKNRKPYSLTGCGHIYCNLCVNEVQKQCPQCKCPRVKLMTLQEPPTCEQQFLFQPLDVHFNNLKRGMQLHVTQFEFVQHRFIDLLRKYDFLKQKLAQCIDNNKIMSEKYEALKEVRKREQKKLTLIETQYRNLVSPSNTTSTVFKTPSTRNTTFHAIKCNTSNPSSRGSIQNVYHQFATLETNPQRLVQRIPASDMPRLSELNINTSRNQQFMKTPYFQHNRMQL